MFHFIALAFYLIQFVFSFKPEEILNLKREDGEEWTVQEGCGACSAAAGILTSSCGESPTDPMEYEEFFTCVCGLNDTFYDVFKDCIQHCPQYPFHRQDVESTELRSSFCAKAEEFANATTTISFPASGLELFGTGVATATLIPSNQTNATSTVTLVVPSTTITNTSPISILSPTAVVGGGSGLDLPGALGLLLFAFV